MASSDHYIHQIGSSDHPIHQMASSDHRIHHMGSSDYPIQNMASSDQYSHQMAVSDVTTYPESSNHQQNSPMDQCASFRNTCNIPSMPHYTEPTSTQASYVIPSHHQLQQCTTQPLIPSLHQLGCSKRHFPAPPPPPNITGMKSCDQCVKPSLCALNKRHAIFTDDLAGGDCNGTFYNMAGSNCPRTFVLDHLRSNNTTKFMLECQPRQNDNIFTNRKSTHSGVGVNQ